MREKEATVPKTLRNKKQFILCDYQTKTIILTCIYGKINHVIIWPYEG